MVLLPWFGCLPDEEKPTGPSRGTGNSEAGSPSRGGASAEAGAANVGVGGAVAEGGAAGDTGAGGRLVDTVPEEPTSTVVATEAVDQALEETLTSSAALDGDGLIAAYPVPTLSLNYDPASATGLELISNSLLGLNENELSTLKAEGLVISKRVAFPTFSYGYRSIYADHLPVYVSADSLLDAVHASFDWLLRNAEMLTLIPELTEMVTGMRRRLLSSSLDATTGADADLYLTVAESLLRGALQSPVGLADPAEAAALYALATEASGTREISLFGGQREEDFSQFVPRGHYTDNELLARYFKAMMWLGRVDLRLIGTEEEDGDQVFSRRQFNAAAALTELLGESEYARYERIDSTITAFIGEHDSMTPKDFRDFLAALGVSTLAESTSLSNQQIIDEIVRGNWGAQRIASRIMRLGFQPSGTLPLDRSFLLFGQRYTVDSHTFVNVTYSRIADRFMPNPLDVAFAALGNNYALPLLSPEFTNTSYVGGLARTRTLVDAHEDAYWEGSVYTHWLGALRSLSPSDSLDLPSMALTPAFQTRILSAQLGSWAELRHDTILYVKQSYTDSPPCEFPDAFVDPYPEFYRRLGRLVEGVRTVIQALPTSADSLKTTVDTWATNFQAVTANLEAMAHNQRSGTAHSAELLEFINDAVTWNEGTGCGGPHRTELAGWYLRLFVDPNMGFEYDPTVADVHTNPSEDGGVLHVGTGTPRLMVVTAETCTGPRAYAGVVMSYGELIDREHQRLTDEQWAASIETSFPDVAWMSSLLAE